MLDSVYKNRTFKVQDKQRHSEAKLHRMAQLIRQRLLDQALAETERKEQLANGKSPAAAVADACGDAAQAQEEELAPPPEENHAARVEELQEELESMQKQKHLLFIKLKEILKKEDQRREKANEAEAKLQRQAEGPDPDHDHDQEDSWKSSGSPSCAGGSGGGALRVRAV